MPLSKESAWSIAPLLDGYSLSGFMGAIGERFFIIVLWAALYVRVIGVDHSIITKKWREVVNDPYEKIEIHVAIYIVQENKERRIHFFVDETPEEKDEIERQSDIFSESSHMLRVGRFIGSHVTISSCVVFRLQSQIFSNPLQSVHQPHVIFYYTLNGENTASFIHGNEEQIFPEAIFSISRC